MNLRYGEVKRMNKKQNGKPKLSKDTLKTAKRLLKYVTETYKMRFILVFVCGNDLRVFVPEIFAG